MAQDGDSHDWRSLVRRETPPHSATRPVGMGIHPQVVYRADGPDMLDALYEGRDAGYVYAREGHPNATVLGAKIDWMEGVTPAMGRGVVTGSGMAAVGAMFLAFLRTGDHVVAGDQLYGRSLRLLKEDLPRQGIATTFADPTDAKAMEAALRPDTKLILVEVVSNPTLRVADMAGIARLARDRGVMLAVDNTFTTPRAFRPFDHGADVVIHSVTKLLAGHTDATLGWVAANTPARNRALYDVAVTWGMTPSPFDCWLAERGLHSFALRYDRATATAALLADRLADAPGVAQVLYPGRPDHPDHNRAAALLQGRFANMVSFRLRGGRAAVDRFVKAAPHIPFAPTLGDVGTTISHPPSSSHRGLTPEARAAIGIDEGFLRVSVGVEDPEQLCREVITAVEMSQAA